MTRKMSLLMAGALLGATTMIIAQHMLPVTTAEAAGSATYEELSVFGKVFERVRAQYVTSPDDRKLVEGAISGMLTSLDPHSSYMNANQAQDLRGQVQGESGGLGLEVSTENDQLKVISLIEGRPAFKAGVQAGDYISEIDGVDIRGMNFADMTEKIRGEPNTPIELTLIRKGIDKPIKLKIMRDVVKVEAVKYRVEGDVGYLYILSFTEQTFDEMRKAIRDIRSKVRDSKLKGFVLDLRLNPGGLLDQAVDVSDAFLDRGEVVSTRSRGPQSVTRFDARPGDLINGKPLIVLINGGSASAAEIVAGALQDHRRGTILGSRSFGKGSVQTITPLGDGALRLTTALYYTPAGKSIQGKGIMPDIVIDQSWPDDLKGRAETVSESSLKGHIKGAQEDAEGSGSVAYVPPDPKDDIQLVQALKLLRGDVTNAAFPPDPNRGLPARPPQKG